MATKTLQHIATYCNILQHIATYCNIYHRNSHHGYCSAQLKRIRCFSSLSRRHLWQHSKWPFLACIKGSPHERKPWEIQFFSEAWTIGLLRAALVCGWTFDVFLLIAVVGCCFLLMLLFLCHFQFLLLLLMMSMLRMLLLDVVLVFVAAGAALALLFLRQPWSWGESMRQTGYEKSWGKWGLGTVGGSSSMSGSWLFLFIENLATARAAEASLRGRWIEINSDE